LPLVIDVREPWEVQTASIREDGFRLLHIPMREVPARLAELAASFGPSQPIACLCHHGMRSLRTADHLMQNGFTNVVNVAGGIDAWSQQVDPSVPAY
jgi:rhodanese-related sulfurtransferase